MSDYLKSDESPALISQCYNALGANHNAGDVDSIYSQDNQNVFNNSDTLKSLEELGFKSTIEQLDKNEPHNEKIRYDYVKKSGFNTAINDSFKDVSDNIKGTNNKIYDTK